ncbi:quinoprotein relay system zinc metallohydrolase 1 [Zavarzinia compransoris]|uniref:Quinoprotein relay system zinc metallohydrolase 1 n=1 Tax=Zavarzinia compransoris TaxID=1264899 RepID=A0A317DWB3_9PROT|nr:quinoprotein relay system zinc metallohydrolase 1 [Zavarzinia compransoris]PWR18702.1 quinoprotein relay system zinc metallohydrolase 1 [Zavarzinia compransoris]TDP48681.1 quinoprotein relay system zinc metallohydrolase 1 [Zavarzinia compransoris]
MIRGIAFVLVLLWSGLAQAFDYGLKAVEVAPETYVVIGAMEHFSRQNGGNIVNTGFIVTAAGVVVIDTGPSLLYGRQLRALIGGITDAPVVLAVNTHAHPDHYLGNGAFDGVPIAALAGTRQAIAEAPPALLDGIYRLVGDAMAGTQSVPPGETLAPGLREVGGHRLEFLALGGHTGADLAVFDRSTGVLFAGDLAFLDRTPTTPQADLDHWLAALETLRALKPALVVPGHGPPAPPPAAFDQTADYLRWLRRVLAEAAAQGLDAAEVMALPLPPAVAALAVAPAEFARSVIHLYPAFERAMLSAK